MLTDANENFTSKDIQNEVGAVGAMSNRTIRRTMNDAGLKYLHLRKKGILYRKDLKARLKFAKKCKRLLPADFWKRGISLYLDGVGFEYKRNPCQSARSSKTMGWRRANQGLDVNCTAKGKKEGKKQARFYVGISYDEGVVMCKRYSGRLNAERYAEIIIPKLDEALDMSCNPVTRRILQDNCPVMNSTLVVEELKDIGAIRFKIPARSPDINCIENIFHEIRKNIQQDAVKRNIQRESFVEFGKRAEKVIKSYSSSKINKVIDSMWKRIDAVIKRNGQRTKY